MNVRSRKTNCGRKKLQIDINQFVRVPLRKRGTIRSNAQALKIPKSTLFNYIQRGENSITADQFHRMLMSHVLQVIKTKWLGNLSDTTIKIQQDNVRPHIEPSDKKFLCKTFEMGLKVDLLFQTPVLDV